jgi:hypothetical protein
VPSSNGVGDEVGFLTFGVGVTLFFGLVFLVAAVELSLNKLSEIMPTSEKNSLRDNLVIPTLYFKVSSLG